MQALLALGAGSACVMTPVPDSAGATDDWAAFGAAVYRSSASERRVLQATALREHESDPTSSSAIRLAIIQVSLAERDQDLEGAVALLDFAQRATASGGEAELAFVDFFRPLVRRLADQQAELNAETEATQVLQRQLEALKALEAQLNAEDALP